MEVNNGRNRVAIANIFIIMGALLALSGCSKFSGHAPSERDLLFFSLADDLLAPQLCQKIHPDSIRDGWNLQDQCLRSYVLNKRGDGAICDKLPSGVVSDIKKLLASWTKAPKQYDSVQCKKDQQSFKTKPLPPVKRIPPTATVVNRLGLLDPEAAMRQMTGELPLAPQSGSLIHANALMELLKSIGYDPQEIGKINAAADKGVAWEKANLEEIRTSENISSTFLNASKDEKFLKLVQSLPDYSESADDNKRRPPNTDECFYEELAKSRLEPSFCRRISPNATDPYLNQPIGFQFESSRDRCFREMAFFKADSKFCGEIHGSLKWNSLDGSALNADYCRSNKSLSQLPRNDYAPAVCEKQTMVKLGYIKGNPEQASDVGSQLPEDLSYFRFYSAVFKGMAEVKRADLLRKLETAAPVAGNGESLTVLPEDVVSERQMTPIERLYNSVAIEFDAPELCERISWKRVEVRGLVDFYYSRSNCLEQVARAHFHRGLCLRLVPYHSQKLADALAKPGVEHDAQKEGAGAVLFLKALQQSNNADVQSACIAGIDQQKPVEHFADNTQVDVVELFPKLGYTEKDFATYHAIHDQPPDRTDMAIENAKFGKVWEPYTKLLQQPEFIAKVKKLPVQEERFNPIHVRPMNRWEYLYQQIGQNLPSREICQKISWNAGSFMRSPPGVKQFLSARLDCQRGVAERTLDKKICDLPLPRSANIGFNPSKQSCFQAVQIGISNAHGQASYRIPINEVWHDKNWLESLTQDFKELGYTIEAVDETFFRNSAVSFDSTKFYRYLRDEADQNERTLFIFRLGKATDMN